MEKALVKGQSRSMVAKEPPCPSHLLDTLENYKKLGSQVRERNKKLENLIVKESLIDSEKKFKTMLEMELEQKTALLERYKERLSYTQMETWIPQRLNDEHTILIDDNGLNKYFTKYFINEIFQKDPEGVEQDCYTDEEECRNDIEQNCSYLSQEYDVSNQECSEDIIMQKCDFLIKECEELIDKSSVMRDAISIKLTLSPPHYIENNLPITTGSSPNNHLTYRAPAPAVLKIEKHCERRHCYPEMLAKQSVSVPQAGSHMALPLINKPFGNNNLIAEFSPNGALINFKYVSADRATALTEALKKTVTTVKAVKDNKNELTELETKTALLKAEADLIRAQRDLDALKVGSESK